MSQNSLKISYKKLLRCLCSCKKSFVNFTQRKLLLDNDLCFNFINASENRPLSLTYANEKVTFLNNFSQTLIKIFLTFYNAITNVQQINCSINFKTVLKNHFIQKLSFIKISYYQSSFYQSYK